MSAEFGVLRSTLRRMYASARVLLTVGVVATSSASLSYSVQAQTPPASTPSRQLGTVKAISGTSLTLATDAGQPAIITLAPGVRVLQLPPGSTDLKAAVVITLADVAVGDRVLVTGKAGETTGQLTASRVILMKSTDIAEKRRQQQSDWQKRGSGGLVNAVDPAAGTLTVMEGAKKVQVNTSPTTIFRRYSGDSIKFEDAVPGTFAQVQVGDQLRVRGAKSEDGSSLQAEEIVSGSFRNFAGTIATIVPADGTITLKDLATKKMITVKVIANSDLRRLPEQAAARFAARARGAAAAGTASAGGNPTRAAGSGAAGMSAGAGPGTSSASGQGTARTGGQGRAGAGGPRREGTLPSTQTEAEANHAGSGGPGPGGAGSGGAGEGSAGQADGARSAGMDLSQMLARLPSETIADLKVGEAVMIVASQSSPTSSLATAVTLLTGVEPILAASPSGAPIALSPWNVGGGAPDGGAAQ